MKHILLLINFYKIWENYNLLKFVDLFSVNTSVKLSISNLKREEMGYLKKSLKILKGQSESITNILIL